MPSIDKRGYGVNRWSLELEGIDAGPLLFASGGEAMSDVIVERAGPDNVPRKHIAGVKYGDIVVTCGAEMSRSFYAWVSDALDARYTRKNGAVIATNAAFDPVSRLDFTRALITEIGFPPLDAGSKDVAKLTVKLTPEYTRAQRGGSKGSNGYAKQGIQKRWLQSNFRLKIDGLDCTHVNRIEPLVVVQKVVDHAVGELRDYQKEPAHIEIPNLVVTLAESHAHDFVAWHEDFVIRGNSGENNEKSGTLELLAPNLQEVLFTVGFRGLGIFKLSRVDSGTTIETIPRLQASMYCEEMTFTVGTGAVAAAPPPASASATGQAAAEPAGPVFIGAEEPPLVVVSGANGPVVTEAIPERFTRIERTT